MGKVHKWRKLASLAIQMLPTTSNLGPVHTVHSWSALHLLVPQTQFHGLALEYIGENFARPYTDLSLTTWEQDLEWSLVDINLVYPLQPHVFPSHLLQMLQKTKTRQELEMSGRWARESAEYQRPMAMWWEEKGIYILFNGTHRLVLNRMAGSKYFHVCQFRNMNEWNQRFQNLVDNLKAKKYVTPINKGA